MYKQDELHQVRSNVHQAPLEVICFQQRSKADAQGTVQRMTSKYSPFSVFPRLQMLVAEKFCALESRRLILFSQILTKSIHPGIKLFQFCTAHEDILSKG